MHLIGYVGWKPAKISEARQTVECINGEQQRFVSLFRMLACLLQPGRQCVEHLLLVTGDLIVRPDCASDELKDPAHEDPRIGSVGAGRQIVLEDPVPMSETTSLEPVGKQGALAPPQMHLR